MAKPDTGWENFLTCSECGAQAGYACRTPKGRKKNTSHDTRPFVIPPSAFERLLNGKETED